MDKVFGGGAALVVINGISHLTQGSVPHIDGVVGVILTVLNHAASAFITILFGGK